MTWRLGVRLALTADRVRLVVTAGAVAVTVAFLLGVLGALPAREAKLARLDARNTVSVGSPAAAGEAAPAGGVRIAFTSGAYWRGQRIEVRPVEAGNGVPLAPGLTRYPGPGELVVSPRLAQILRSSRGSELSTRFPGTIVGTISSAGLAGPDELYAYVGAQGLDPELSPIARFGYARDRITTPPELKVAALLGAAGLLLPVLVLVATATRLSAASRDRRLSALRLVGATPTQAAGLAAADGVVAGILGVAGGLGLFLLLRPVACALLPYPEGVYAGDLAPPVPSLLLVVLGVPVLAALTGVLALRRVVTSPLGVRRTARVRTAGWWRLAPVLLGLVLLVVMRLRSGGPTYHVDTPLLLTGGGLTLVGLAVAAPALSRASARLLERVPGLSSSLAARRVEADPGASARVVTGMVLVVFVAAWLLAFLPVLKDSGGYQPPGDTVPAGTLTAYGMGEQVPTERLRQVPGARAVLSSRVVRVALPGRLAEDGSTSGEVSVLACADLAAFLGADLGCGSSRVQQLASADGGGYAGNDVLRPGVRLQVLGDGGRRVGSLDVPPDAPRIVVPSVLTYGLLGSALLVDPSLVPSATAREPVRVAVRTDGTADAVERVRAALPQQLALASRTFEEEASNAGAVYLGYLRAVKIGLVLALLIAAASLAVSTADAVHERRRSLAALLALGTPVRVLRRTVLLQMGAPMLGNVVGAVAAAAVASACYLGTFEQGYSLPWTSWLLTALGGLAAVVLATAATLPLLRAVARPDALRTE